MKCKDDECRVELSLFFVEETNFTHDGEEIHSINEFIHEVDVIVIIESSIISHNKREIAFLESALFTQDIFFNPSLENIVAYKYFHGKESLFLLLIQFTCPVRDVCFWIILCILTFSVIEVWIHFLRCVNFFIYRKILGLRVVINQIHWAKISPSKLLDVNEINESDILQSQ